MRVSLKPQDVVVLVYLANASERWSYPSVATALGMSASEVHASVRRSAAAGLFDPEKRRPLRANLLEFLVHGLKYVFPVERGGMTRGTPTAHGAPPLKRSIMTSVRDPAPVWPDPLGEARGESWSPLYRSVPGAARNDPVLYEAMALIDAVRGGRARERALAIDELSRRLA